VGCFTLVNRAIRITRKINQPVYVVISTDDESIIRRYGKKVDLCIRRKTELSTSDSKISDVIIDTINHLKYNSDDDILLLLEPSSPNRNILDLNQAIDAMLSNNYEAVTTVSVLDKKFHPYKLLKQSRNGQLIPYSKNSPIISNRQQINETVFYRNGLAYLYKFKVARKLNKSLPDKTHFIVTDRSVSNIDNQFDLSLARFLNFKYYTLRNFFKIFK
jgi:N-acylneuraminate cytidylyltransferase